MSAIEFNPLDAEIIDFKVMNEDWQYYKLSDGSKLKSKLALTQIMRARNQVDQTGQPLYTWNTQNLMSIVAIGEGLRGTPSTVKVTSPEMITSNIEATLDFESVGKQDEWNVYTLSDGTVLRLRANVNSIARTKLKGAAGEPIYSMNAGIPNYRIKVPPNLIRKPSSPASKSTLPRPCQVCVGWTENSAIWSLSKVVGSRRDTLPNLP